MLPYILYLLFALSAAAPHPLTSHTSPLESFSESKYGVGMSLSLDYGTSSIYFANGTVADVAKVEGSVCYKQVMKRLYSTYGHSIPPRYPSEETPERLAPTQHPLQSPDMFGTAQHCRSSSSEAAVIADMLTALKITSESFAESPVHAVDLVVPLAPPESSKHHLQTAAKLAGLNHDTVIASAGYMAARAHGLSPCFPPTSSGDHSDGRSQAQVILTIDYTRAALTAVLWLAQNGVFEQKRILHDLDLGTSALERLRPSEGSAPFYERLTEALAQMVKMPLRGDEGGGMNLPSALADVLVLGENAADVRLGEALYRALEAEHGLQSMKSVKPRHSEVRDPMFVAARGGAAASWERQSGLVAPKEN